MDVVVRLLPFPTGGSDMQTFKGCCFTVRDGFLHVFRPKGADVAVFPPSAWMGAYVTGDDLPPAG